MCFCAFMERLHTDVAETPDTTGRSAQPATGRGWTGTAVHAVKPLGV